MDKKAVLSLSVSQENKEFAIDQFKLSNGRYASVSHWANELLNKVRIESEVVECVKK